MTLFLTRQQWVDFQDVLCLPDPPTEEECEKLRQLEDEEAYRRLEEAFVTNISHESLSKG